MAEGSIDLNELLNLVQSDGVAAAYDQRIAGFDTAMQLYLAIKFVERFEGENRSERSLFDLSFGRSRSNLVLSLASKLRDPVLEQLVKSHEAADAVVTGIDLVQHDSTQSRTLMRSMFSFISTILDPNTHQILEERFSAARSRSQAAVYSATIEFLQTDTIASTTLAQSRTVVTALRQSVEQEIPRIDTHGLLQLLNTHFDTLSATSAPFGRQPNRLNRETLLHLSAYMIAQVEGEFGYFRLIGLPATPSNIATYFAPYIYALSEIQKIIDQINGREPNEPVITITKSGSLLVQVSEPIKQAIELIFKIVPRRRKAEAVKVELENDKKQLENRLYATYGSQRQEIRLQKELLELEQQRWALEREKRDYYIRLADEIVSAYYPDLDPRDKINYIVSLGQHLAITAESPLTPQIGWREPPPSTLPEG